MNTGTSNAVFGIIRAMLLSVFGVGSTPHHLQDKWTTLTVFEDTHWKLRINDRLCFHLSAAVKL